MMSGWSHTSPTRMKEIQTHTQADLIWNRWGWTRLLSRLSFVPTVERDSSIVFVWKAISHDPIKYRLDVSSVFCRKLIKCFMRVTLYPLFLFQKGSICWLFLISWLLPVHQNSVPEFSISPRLYLVLVENVIRHLVLKSKNWEIMWRSQCQLNCICLTCKKKS